MAERLTCDAGQTAGPALLTEEQAAFCAGRILSNYGLGLVRAKWEGITPLVLKAELARQLGGISWPAIVAGLDAMPGRHPDYPPNIGQLQALCKGCEPTKFYAALPAPDISPAVIAARQAEAEAMARKVAAPRYDFKAWAKKLRAEFLAGGKLDLQQQVMGSEAIGERWHMDNGKRECSPIEQAEAA